MRRGQRGGEAGAGDRRRGPRYGRTPLGLATTPQAVPASVAREPSPSTPSRLADGSQPLAVDAVDAADNLARLKPAHDSRRQHRTGCRRRRPRGGSGWRNQNGFDLTWTNPAEGDRAPIAAAHYRICRPERQRMRAGQAVRGRASPACRRSDRAGARRMADPRLARGRRGKPRAGERIGAGPAPLRPRTAGARLRGLAPSDPTLHLRGGDRRDLRPRRGQIELSRQGTGTWQTLATQRRGRAASSPESTILSCPPASTPLRATAWDQASNQNSTDARANGEPMTLTLPVRVPTVLQAGIVTNARSADKSNDAESAAP